MGNGFGAYEYERKEKMNLLTIPYARRKRPTFCCIMEECRLDEKMARLNKRELWEE
ncbi:MAG: hypothetical protein ACFFCW_30950 [Candidatus Hodarchaeota archaeon]